MGIFNGIGGVKSSQDSNYIRPCEGVFQINSVKHVVSQTNKSLVIIELTAVHVDGGHKPGEEVSHILNTAHMSWMANFKNFLTAALDCSDEEVTEEVCEQILGNNALAGEYVKLVARDVETKSGNPFTKVIYKGNVTADYAGEDKAAEAS